jgi:hypothetical protein
MRCYRADRAVTTESVTAQIQSGKHNVRQEAAHITRGPDVGTDCEALGIRQLIRVIGDHRAASGSYDA